MESASFGMEEGHWMPLLYDNHHAHHSFWKMFLLGRIKCWDPASHTIITVHLLIWLPWEITKSGKVNGLWLSNHLLFAVTNAAPQKPTSFCVGDLMPWALSDVTVPRVHHLQSKWWFIVSYCVSLLAAEGLCRVQTSRRCPGPWRRKGK